MAYDDVKQFQGRAYSGMRVGGRHDWDYPDGRWQETKAGPDEWSFTFRSQKKRRHHAPPGSGVPADSKYHWFILAHQRVRKIDEDTYDTVMEGTKHKIGHRRPHWRRWSTEQPDAQTARERVAQILEDTARALRAEGPEIGARLEPTLDPAVLRAPQARSLDEFDEG